MQITERNESCNPISYARERGFMRDNMTATISGRSNAEKRYHHRLAPYPMTPIRAARHTGVSAPTKSTNPPIVTVIMRMRHHGVTERRNNERKIISIITFDPLTTMICMSPDALRSSLSSASRLFFCPRIMPESISRHRGGNIAVSFPSNHVRIRIKIPYFSGGVLSTRNDRNSAIILRFQSCFSD